MKNLLKKHRNLYEKEGGNVYEKKIDLFKNLLSMFKKSSLIPAYFNYFGLKSTIKIILNYFQYQLNHSKLYTLPKRVDIELSSKCNQKCVQCIRATEKYDNSNEGLMSYENFVRIIDQFSLLEKLYMFGIGEPTINKDLFKMIDYVKSRKSPPIVNVTSNGLILNKYILEKLINLKYKPDELCISLDATTSKTYYNIKETNLDFNNILKNIKKLTLNKDFKNTEIYITMVVMEQNYKEMPDFIRLAHKLRVDGVNFLELYPTWIYEKNKHIKIKFPEKLRETVFKTKKLAKEMNISMTYDCIDSNIWGLNKGYHPCRYPWSGIYITWKGYVTPCCLRPYAHKFNFGNILIDGIQEIWNSKKYINFRTVMSSKKLPLICEPCFAKH